MSEIEISGSRIVITHPLTRTGLRCRISSLRQYRAAVALKVIVGEIPVVRSVARPFWSPLLERYWSEAELLSNGLGSTVWEKNPPFHHAADLIEIFVSVRG